MSYERKVLADNRTPYLFKNSLTLDTGNSIREDSIVAKKIKKSSQISESDIDYRKTEISINQNNININSLYSKPNDFNKYFIIEVKKIHRAFWQYKMENNSFISLVLTLQLILEAIANSFNFYNNRTNKNDKNKIKKDSLTQKITKESKKRRQLPKTSLTTICQNKDNKNSTEKTSINKNIKRRKTDIDKILVITSGGAFLGGAIGSIRGACIGALLALIAGYLSERNNECV